MRKCVGGLEVRDARGGEGVFVEGVKNMCKRFQGWFPPIFDCAGTVS